MTIIDVNVGKNGGNHGSKKKDMTRREKLIDKMSRSPGNIRFVEVDALLRYEGFVLFNQRGSHCTYHRADGRVLTIVKPHGGRKTCHPTDIRRLLRVLGYEHNA